MPSRLNITIKIWLSIGVFVLGYVLSTTLVQMQGLRTEDSLSTLAEARLSAVQRSHETEAAFQRTVKAFSDAMVTQDPSMLDGAAKEGRQVVDGLKTIAGIPALSDGHSDSARKLASSAEQLIGEARATYTTALTNPAGMGVETLSQIQEMASRTEALKSSLGAGTRQLTNDLHTELNALRSRSARQRSVALALFGITLALAAVVVNLTIRRAIVGPIVRVIHGVEGAAGGAAHASERMAQSGKVLAHEAQDQAASVEETSALLAEISANMRENAGRAGEADALMRDARQTADKASEAMNDLTISMDEISKSSRQVAGVLKSIDEIAFQTNILSLNAAVEAARAGQAGAGFNVVAGEVRSLALRAAEAARRSGDIIEKTIGDVGNGVHLVAAAQGAFTEVSAKIAAGSNVVTQIAASSDEQARGIGHISGAVARIEKVTQSTTANSQETADAAAAVTSQIEATRKHLSELVAVVGLRQS